MNTLKFQCCFCSEGISQSDIDPCRINIMGNYARSSKVSPSQDFYCHFKCLKDLLDTKISGYLIETTFVDEEHQEKYLKLNDKFIEPKEMLEELNALEHEAFNINRRIELLSQHLKYIFSQIKNCETLEGAMGYFKLLDKIHTSLAFITFAQGISLPIRLSKFVYDFDNFEEAYEYYFPKIQSGEYTL